jgi:predicted DNA-binding transcriptional regulator YafY
MKERDKPKFEIALESVRTYRGLNITYRDWLGQITSRAILPVRVYELGDVVYVQAYCWLTKEVEHFALPGILRIELRPKTVEKAVYIGFRDRIDELGNPLPWPKILIESVNLEEV